MKLYEAVADALVAEGCEVVFGLMGDANMPMYAAIGSRNEITIHAARHEGGAVGMADGYHRASGRVGLATVTWGPGLTQIATQLTVAVRNRTPMIVLTGAPSKPVRDKHQWLDHQLVTNLCGARRMEVTSTSDAAEQIAEAFYAAQIHRIPVLLEVPIDLQMQELDWDWDYRPSALHIPSPVPMPCSETALAPIADALAAAQRPIIIAGRGAVLARAKTEIVDLGERAGALLATSLLAKNWFIGHDWDIGIAGSFASAVGEELFAQADFVLGIGAEMQHFTTEGGLLFPNANVARIDIKETPDEIGTTPGLYARGDARLSAAALSAMLAGHGPRQQGYRTAAVRHRLDAPAEIRETRQDGLDPRRLMEELSLALPANVRVICGVGHFWSLALMYLSLPEDAQFETILQFGAIGQAFVQGIGSAAAGTGRPQLVIDGDGSFLMQMAECETAVRIGVPLVVVLVNNSGYGAEVHKLKAKGFNSAAAGLVSWKSPDFVQLVRTLGGDGTVVDVESQIAPAMAAGLASGRLFVIDARVSPDVVSDSYKRLHFGEANHAPRLRAPKGGLK